MFRLSGSILDCGLVIIVWSKEMKNLETDFQGKLSPTPNLEK